MNELERRLRRYREEGRVIPIAYVMSGDPDPETTIEIIRGLSEGGACAVELGIPFTDPIGDGPVIQEAGRRALMSGTTVKTVMEIARCVSKCADTGIVTMTYFNPVFRYGIGNFFRDARMNGISASIIPDLPFDEGGAVLEESSRQDVALVQLVSEMTSPERIDAIVRVARGFIYLLSKPGTTGGTLKLSERFKQACRTVRSKTDLPVCIGFGVRKKEDVALIKSHADGFIVGTALIREVEKSKTAEEKRKRARRFMQALLE